MKKNNKGNATSHIDSENNDSDLRKQEKEYFEEGSAFVEDFDISEGSIPREKFIFGEEDQSGESSSSSAHPDFENALNSRESSIHGEESDVSEGFIHGEDPDLGEESIHRQRHDLGKEYDVNKDFDENVII